MENNFIHTFNLKDLSICDNLISMFNDKNNDKFKKPGRITKGIDKNVKDSVDMEVSIFDNNTIINSYYEELKIGINNYYEKYGKYMASVSIKENWNIQYYPPGGGFKTWHSERTDKNKSIRYLVFMTYLNNVDNAGTEWLYQNYKTEAKKGLSVIWPVDFTHVHRGIISQTQEKYITTGWFSL
jgi:hypothetical protein